MKQKINYWTEIGLAAKKQLQSQKIKVGKSYRHPKLNEITFEDEEVISLPTKSKEEYRKDFLLRRKEAKGKLENIPYSSYHNKLINQAYGKVNNALKKAAYKAAHEEHIKQLIIKRSIYLATKAFGYDSSKPNLLIINRCNKDWKVYNFMTIPSSLSLESLRHIGMNMRDKLINSLTDFFNIEIWERTQYIKHMKGELATYRYQISK